MKILYVIHQFYPDFYSGTERVAGNIADMVQKIGNIVKFVTYSPKHNISDGERFGNITYKDYMFGKIPVTEFYTEDEDLFFNVNLVNERLYDFAKMILEKEKPDVVHVMHPMRVGIFAKVAQDMGIKTVITVTDLMYICSRVIMCNEKSELCCSAKDGKECDLVCSGTGKSHRERLLQAEMLLKKADCVTTPSSFIAGMVKAELNGVEALVVRHGVDVVGTKKAIYNKNDKLTFAFVGSIQKHKGVHLFVENAMKVKSSNVAFKLYGDYNNPYGEALIKRAKKDKRIVFEGKFEKKEALGVYEGCDVLVVPSQCYESYSMVKNEALSAGVPVIVADLGALPEGIEHKKNGFVFDASKQNSLCEIMEEIVSNPTILNDVKEEMKKIFVPIKEQEAFKYCSIYKNIKE